MLHLRPLLRHRASAKFIWFSSLSEALSQIASETRTKNTIVEQTKVLASVVSRADWDPNSRLNTGTVDTCRPGLGLGFELKPDHVSELVRGLQGESRHVWALRVYIWACRQPGYKHNAVVRTQVLELWQYGELVDPFLRLIDMHSEINSAEKYELLIQGYGWARMPDLAMATLGRMISSGFEPDVSHFNSLLYVLVQENRFKNMKELFKHMLERGVNPNQSTYALRVRGYSVAGQFDEALKAYRQMLKAGFPPDLKTYGMLMDVMCKSGNGNFFYVIVHDLHKYGFRPNVPIYHETLQGLCRNSCVKYAERLVKLIAERGIDASPVVYNIIAKGLCRERKLTKALVHVHDMLKRGFLPDFDVCDLLLILLFKEGRLGNIFKLLDKLVDRGFSPHYPTYNILVYGLSKCNEVGKAFDAWRILVQFSIPSSKSYRALIEGLCRLGMLTEAKQVFKQTLEKGGIGDPSAHDTLLYRLKQAGRTNDAKECEEILERMKESFDMQTYILDGPN